MYGGVIVDKNLRLANLWDEWLSCEIVSQREADYEASGLLMGMKHTHLAFTTNRLRAARRLTGPGKVRLWSLTSYAENFPLAISMTTRTNCKPSIRFTCPHRILRLPGKNHIWPWLKGLWGSTGGLYFPKAGYYLTLIVSSRETSAITRDVLALTGLSWSEHRNEFTLRNHDDIMTFLCNAGMPSGALAFDEAVMMRSIRNRANLESNYETANIARSVRAAREQKLLAERITAEGMTDHLTHTQQEILRLRLEYPDCTLGELGEKLTPQISKSSVKYHWDKIKSILHKYSSYQHS